MAQRHGGPTITSSNDFKQWLLLMMEVWLLLRKHNVLIWQVVQHEKNTKLTELGIPHDWVSLNQASFFFFFFFLIPLLPLYLSLFLHISPSILSRLMKTEASVEILPYCNSISYFSHVVRLVKSIHNDFYYYLNYGS